MRFTETGGGEALSVRQVLGEVVPAFDRLREQGKTRFLGLTAVGDTAALHQVIRCGRLRQRSGSLQYAQPVRGRRAAGIGDSDERRIAIREVLAARGFVDGRNLLFEPRWGDSLFENIEALKAAKVDVIITFGFPASLAAKTLAKDMPIVCTGAGDPVATGLAQSLARPGGNLTGYRTGDRTQCRNSHGGRSKPQKSGDAVQCSRSRHDLALSCC
jgi:ABC transporter substrate binding protein